MQGMRDARPDFAATNLRAGERFLNSAIITNWKYLRIAHCRSDHLRQDLFRYHAAPEASQNAWQAYKQETKKYVKRSV
ncbi:hypothetical protein LT85_1961 [Collimonas arenae]|uniref:Uncharacterized protein n=1 Tax=Collimonas arenae TaxID=279058 RepID=A0A0A1FBQ9_9BURK|nr:hypothetical protein LT85_1961 [Collimonas arenae]